MEINCVKKKTNNCNTARKFGTVEANVRRWKEQKQKLINTNSTRKSFSDSKNGHFQHLEQEIVEFVYLNWKSAVPVTFETTKYKAWELAKWHVTRHHLAKWHVKRHHFKASTVWCVYDAEEWVRSLQKNFALPEITSRLQGEACCFSATCDCTWILVCVCVLL